MQPVPCNWATTTGQPDNHQPSQWELVVSWWFPGGCSSVTTGSSCQRLGSSIHFPLFCVINQSWVYLELINSVTGLGVAFMGSPEQSSQSLTRSLKLGVKIAFMGPPEQSSWPLARSLRLFITQVRVIWSVTMKTAQENLQKQPLLLVWVITELFTVFSLREWLFGIWTNVNWGEYEVLCCSVAYLK